MTINYVTQPIAPVLDGSPPATRQISGASNALAAISRMKNALSASHVNNPLISGSASGVTITAIALGSADAGLTNKYQYYTADSTDGRPNAFRLSGGLPTQFNGTGAFVMFPSSRIVPGNNGNLAGALSASLFGWNYNGWTWTVEWETDAPLQEIHFLPANNQLCSLQIDGQFASSPITPFSYSNEQIIRVDFSSVRKWRKFVFRSRGVSGFRGTYVDDQSRVSAPVDTPIVFEAYGTSITEGAAINVPSGTQDPDAPFIHRLGHLMGWKSVTARGSGSCGYLANSSGTRYTARQQLAFWDTVPDVCMVNAAYNDVGASVGGDFPRASIVAECVADFQARRAAWPNALILVTGIEGGSRGPTQAQIDCENAMADAIAAINDPLSAFVRISTDEEPWLFGTGNYLTASSDGNAGLYMSNDVTHPTATGHIYLADRYASAISRIITSL